MKQTGTTCATQDGTRFVVARFIARLDAGHPPNTQARDESRYYKRKTNTQGYTLIFTLGIVGLLAALGAMLTMPSATQQKRVELHYRNVQAQYLSLAGLEQAKTWAAQGIVTNELYLLANGVVDTTMEPVDGNQCRVVSIGRLRTPWRNHQITARNEVTIPLGKKQTSQTSEPQILISTHDIHP
jgi:hypothetical protein